MPKTKKVKSTITENGETREVEIEVPDVEVSWGKPENRRLIGSHMTRTDGRDKVTGRAKYTYDINLPGLLHGDIVRSPHAKARIVAIDLEPAKAMPGVRAVLALKEPGTMVRYAGDEIAALAAVSPEIARDAVRSVRVQYEVLPFVVKEDAARDPEAPRVLGNDRPNVEPGRSRSEGDVDKAFAEAAGVVEAEYRAQARVHACLETHGHVVAFAPDGSSVRVWASTQAVHPTAEQFAGIAQLPKDKVEVICEHMGGGFGSKFGPGVEGRAAALLAKMAGAPVKLMLDRRAESEAAGNAPSAIMKVKIAGAPDGTITAVEGRGYGTGGLGGAGIPFPYLYRVAAQRAAQDTVRTNIGPSNSMRAPGHPQGSFVMESAVDELAYKLGMDPLELRRKNDPSKIRQAEYTLGAERIGWKAKWNPKPDARGGPRKRGVGVASATWGGGGGGGSQVDVKIAPDGSVVVALGTQDLGTGTRTYVAAIVAEELGLPREAVRAEIGNSKLGYSGGSGGSTTTPSVAPAVKMAAVQAKFDFLSALAKATGEPLEKLEMGPGGTVTNGTKQLSWLEAAKRLPAGGVSSRGTWVPDLQQTGVGGVQFAEVEVDVETGRVRVVHLVAVQDCGIPMNKLALESQINGGLIQGMGFALLEDRVMDWQTGRMVNPNLEEYKLPGPREMPIFETIIYEYPEAKGVSGVAEPAVIPTASAIANAVYNACGARVRTLPLIPKHVLEALGKAEGEPA